MRWVTNRTQLNVLIKNLLHLRGGGGFWLSAFVHRRQYQKRRITPKHAQEISGKFPSGDARGEFKMMNMNFYLALSVIVFFVMCCDPAMAEDDFQYRQMITVKMLDTEKLDLSMQGQVRFNHDAQDVSFYLVSPQLKYDLAENLTLGLNYSYVNFKAFEPSAGREKFKFHHRLELEVNPHWDIGEWLLITTMNRYEFRWVEDAGSDNPRARHRTQLEFPLKHLEPVKSFYVSSEFFYDINDHRYNENWTIPLGVKFKIASKTSLSTYYMIQSKLTDAWSTTQIFGTSIFISF